MSDQIPLGTPSDRFTLVGDGTTMPGVLAGKYRVERVIGEGSFGRVYLATPRTPKRETNPRSARLGWEITRASDISLSAPI